MYKIYKILQRDKNVLGLTNVILLHSNRRHVLGPSFGRLQCDENRNTKKLYCVEITPQLTVI
jgi:hypothetical protein